MYPPELRYYREHQWVRASDDGVGVIGISFFAQEELGDIVYVDLGETGADLTREGKFGEVESVKTVSDLFTPVSGTVVEVNVLLGEEPGLVNDDPYGAGWMLRVKMIDPSELDSLMSAREYEQMIGRAG